MIDFNDFIFLEFQIVLSFIWGYCSGPMSMGIEYALIMMFITEIIIFSITENSLYKTEARILINIFYFSGWILGRWLYTKKTGFEHYQQYFYTPKPYFYFADLPDINNKENLDNDEDLEKNKK